MFLKSEQGYSVSCCKIGDRGCRCASQLGNLFYNERYVLRFVDFSSERNRSEVRSVGLHQQSIGGDFRRNLLDLMGVFKGNDSGDTYVEAELEKALSPFPGSRETMDHAPQAGMFAKFLVENFFRLAAVKNNRKIVASSHLQMRPEALQLNLHGDEIVMALQAGFPNDRNI